MTPRNDELIFVFAAERQNARATAVEPPLHERDVVFVLLRQRQERVLEATRGLAFSLVYNQIAGFLLRPGGDEVNSLGELCPLCAVKGFQAVHP